MGKSMIIVGAGIAGLSTGTYACMNGYKTTIFEMHDIPGGLCTAWKRKGYTFDISMHMLMGSKSGPLHQMWRELGVIENQKFHYHNEMVRIESGEKCLSLGTDPRELETQMLALSPTDKERIKEFVCLLAGKSITDTLSLKPAELLGLKDGLKMIPAILPHIMTILKYRKKTIQEFVQGFEDPFLRRAVRYFIDSPGWPMLRFPMIALSGYLKASILEAGVPQGGSQGVIQRMAKNYEQFGGTIQYKSRVADIIIENERAVGIRLEDGTEHRADIVVWAGDGHTAIFDILGGRYLSDTVRKIYDSWTPVLPLVHVMLGVNRDLSKEPPRIVFEIDNPISIAGQEYRWLYFLHHCFDPSMSPEGKSAVEVWYATRFDFWEGLARDRTKYQEEKKRIADVTIAELDKRWPGFASQVEVVDVPTPATYVRYTGNWRGSPDGWYVTPENMATSKMLRTLPGLSAFYMVGQWTVPFSGTVLAALSGRQLVQLLTGREGKPFMTSNR